MSVEERNAKIVALALREMQITKDKDNAAVTYNDELKTVRKELRDLLKQTKAEQV